MQRRSDQNHGANDNEAVLNEVVRGTEMGKNTTEQLIHITGDRQLKASLLNQQRQFRQLNKNARGNYLMPLFATSDVREISPRGEVVKITRLEGTPFTTLALANGNHWVACGDGHSLMEVNLDNGEVARRYGENDIKGARLFFVAGLLPAKDGGLYVCNWQGHDKNAVEANSPQVFEINDKGEVIWNLNDNEKFGMISTISTIE